MSTPAFPLRTPTAEARTATRRFRHGWLVSDPDSLTAEQYAPRRVRPASSAYQLAAAVLARALDDLALPPVSPAYQATTEAALAWLRDDDTTWPYSARNLCDHLGVDIAAMRQTLDRPRVAGSHVHHDPRGHRSGTDDHLLAAGAWGALLGRVRRRHMLGQRALARQLSVTAWQISEWERGLCGLSDEARQWVRDRMWTGEELRG